MTAPRPHLTPGLTPLHRWNRGAIRAALLIAVALLLSGCDRVFNFAGVYVPTWVVSCVIAFGLSHGSMLLIARRGAIRYIAHPPLLFLSLMVIYAYIVWCVTIAL